MQISALLNDIEIPKISFKNKIKGRYKIAFQNRQISQDHGYCSNYQQQHYLKPKQSCINSEFQRSNTNPQELSFIKFRNEKKRSYSSQKQSYENLKQIRTQKKEINQIQIKSSTITKQNSNSISKLQKFLRSQMTNNKILQSLDIMRNRNKSISNVKSLRTKYSPETQHKNLKLITLNSDSCIKGKPIFPQQYKDKLVYRKNSQLLDHKSLQRDSKGVLNVIKTRQNKKYKNYTSVKQQYKKLIDPKPSYQVLVYKTFRNQLKFSSIGSH